MSVRKSEAALKKGYDSHKAKEGSDGWVLWTVLTEFVKNEMIAHRFSYDDSKKKFMFVVFQAEESPLFYEAEIVDTSYDGLEDCQSKWVLFKNADEFGLGEFHKRDFEFCYNPNLSVKSIESDDKLLESAEKAKAFKGTPKKEPSAFRTGQQESDCKEDAFAESLSDA